MFALIALLSASTSASAGPCPAGYSSSGDACYKIINGGFNFRNYGETVAACKADNPSAYLATFRHKKDWHDFMQFLESKSVKSGELDSIWISGSDKDQEGQWTATSAAGLTCRMNNHLVCGICGTWTNWDPAKGNPSNLNGKEHHNTVNKKRMNDLGEDDALHVLTPVCQVANFDVCRPCESKANRPDGCYGEPNQCLNAPTYGMCGYNKAAHSDAHCQFPMSVYQGKCTCIPSASTDSREGTRCCSNGSKPNGKCPAPTDCLVDANCLVTFDPEQPSMGGKCVKGKCQPM